jgi:hypothetical protein
LVEKEWNTILESAFQHILIKELKRMFPGCIVLKNDPNYLQGFPDLLILWKDKWATLEVKRSASAPIQPNQKFYVDMMNNMSYSSFIHPGNKEAILHELQQSFGS